MCTSVLPDKRTCVWYLSINETLTCPPSVHEAIEIPVDISKILYCSNFNVCNGGHNICLPLATGLVRLDTTLVVKFILYILYNISYFLIYGAY